jgi:hypothetical protein
MLQIKVLIPIAILSSSIGSIFAQTENKDVTITASGSGATQEVAKQVALRSAIEQAYGAFISTKTEMFNDQVVADEMISVSAGNIKSYEILNQDSLPDGRWGLTLKAVVSIDKLTSFVEAKGGTVEIKGGLFALNIKQQLLNEQGEIKAVAEMIGILHEPMQTAFDYSIKSGEPKSIDAESKNWAIPLEVTATCNKNMEFCANYFIKTLKALTLTENEKEIYKSLNKKVFEFSLDFAENRYTFYLRKQQSIKAIESFCSNWFFYTHLFEVYDGVDTILGSCTPSEIYRRKCPWQNLEYFKFLSAGQIFVKYNSVLMKSLRQIESMTNLSVKPRGIVSNYKNGGYIVFEKNGHGLVAALFDLGDGIDWNSAYEACNELDINGYSDWRLPDEDELWLIYKYLGGKGIGGFKSPGRYYWSSTFSSYDGSYKSIDVVDGRSSSGTYQHMKGVPHPVRTF